MNTLLVIVASVAVVALVGWSATLIAFARSLLPMANALSVLDRVDDRVDARITKVVDRILSRKDSQGPKPQSIAGVPTGPNAAAAALRDLFGGSPIEDIGEQPDDAGLEIVE